MADIGISKRIVFEIEQLEIRKKGKS